MKHELAKGYIKYYPDGQFSQGDSGVFVASLHYPSDYSYALALFRARMFHRGACRFLITVLVSFMDILLIAFAASIPLFFLVAGGQGVRFLLMPLNASAIQLHQPVFLLLAIFTILCWINHKVGAAIPNLMIAAMLLAPVLLLAGIGAWREKRSASLFDLALFWGKLFLLCLAISLTYVFANTPDKHQFIPAIDNNDVFTYLIRGYSLFGNSSQIAAQISGSTPVEILDHSSKFASALFLGLFTTLVREPGIAAAAGMVAVKASLIHLIWSAFRPAGQPWYLSLLWLLLLAFLPTLDIAGLRFHFSQIMWIYVTLLTMISIDELFQASWGKALLQAGLIVSYQLLLYPIAFPLFAVFALIAFLYRSSGYAAFPWRRLLLFALFCGGAYLLMYFFELHGTDYEHHLHGPYDSMRMLPLSGHLFAPIGFRIFSGGPFVMTPDTLLIAMDLLLVCILLLLVWWMRFDRKRAFMALLMLVGAVALYLALYVTSEHNYRAYKFSSTAVTLAMLLMVGIFIRNASAFRKGVLATALVVITAINVLSLTRITLNRSVSDAFRQWADSVRSEDRAEIFCDFHRYRVNLDLPFLFPGRSVHSLRNSYYCSPLSAAGTGTTTYFSDRPEQELEGSVVRKYPGGIKEVLIVR